MRHLTNTGILGMLGLVICVILALPATILGLILGIVAIGAHSWKFSILGFVVAAISFTAVVSILNYFTKLGKSRQGEQ